MIQKQSEKVSQHRDKTGCVKKATAPQVQPDHYTRLHSGFQWQVPTCFNIAQVCCARWAALPERSTHLAVIEHTPGSGLPNSGLHGHTGHTGHTFAQLQSRANQLSNLLKTQGVKPGDRVAIVMPQRFDTAVAYMAVLQMGAVAVPLSILFGPDALEYRLADSDAVVAMVDAAALANLREVRANCPEMRVAIVVGDLTDELTVAVTVGPSVAVVGDAPNAATATSIHVELAYAASMAQASATFEAINTLAEQAAVLIYTSGTTGPPKGALIPHRALLGNLTGFVCSQNWFGFDGVTNASSDAVFWSPADWTWTGGLMDALLPTLYFGRPIVAFNGRFGPDVALELMRDHGITHTFLFPTALKAMMKAFPGAPGRSVRQQFNLQLQAIMSAGEAVGDAVFDYCDQQLGTKVNEMFGQTEINYIVGNSSKFWPSKPGSMGKGYPGHRVRVIDDAGDECAVGVPGDVAVNRYDVHGHPDPVFFLGYWKNEAATKAKFTGDWCRTGDLATRDADGYLWYQGRADDVFKAAGYRIGPGEVENCLVKHPAVANAAVVPKPDAGRGAVVKAYVVLAPDFALARLHSGKAKSSFDQNLIAQLQAHVKGKLAPYEYPKEVEFVDELPMTTTGKVQRRVLRLQEEARAAVAG